MTIMTICKFYSNGYCRYGNNCRFEHIDGSGSRDYQKTHYNRNDGRQQSQPVANTSNKVGFSFNRTLENVSSNKRFGQQMPFTSNSSKFRPNDTQMSSINRNVFHSTNYSIPANQKTANFSFNRTLHQISRNERPSHSVVFDDIEMDPGAVHRMQANTASHLQTNAFGLFSQSNNSNLNANKSVVLSQNETLNTNASIASKSSSDLKANDEIYSKICDLNENDKKQFESNVFTYRCIPICPPSQSLCF